MYRRQPSPSCRGWAVVVVSSVVMVAALAGPAHAIHIDSLYPTTNTGWPCVNGVSGGGTPTNGFCRTDNADTSWYPDSDNSNGSGDIRNPGLINTVLENEYDAKTALSMRRTTTPKFSGSGETDIIYQQGTLRPGALGQTWCNDALEGTNECDQQYVRFTSHNPLKYLICHETGHAVGLTHGREASPRQSQNVSFFYCMRVGQVNVPPPEEAVIGPSGGTIGSQLNEHYQNQ